MCSVLLSPLNPQVSNLLDKGTPLFRRCLRLTPAVEVSRVGVSLTFVELRLVEVCP